MQNIARCLGVIGGERPSRAIFFPYFHFLMPLTGYLQEGDASPA